MKGGVPGIDTAEQLIVEICDLFNVKNYAIHEITQYRCDLSMGDTTLLPTPPAIFKIGLLSSVDENDKVISINVSSKVPVGNSGEVVAVNTKAARFLRELYGLFTPDYRCAAHISSGTIKRLATSKNYEYSRSNLALQHIENNHITLFNQCEEQGET